MRNKGRYVGTLRTNRPWYSRIARDGVFGEKGTGEYWYDYKGFYFVRQGTGRGLVIPLSAIVEVKLGRWHGVSFSIATMVKIIWKQGGEKLSSGFVVDEPEQLRQALTAAGWA